ncbi:hypothetical protein GPB2148_2017 [marine gamma proteobacterium HTCC2148]|nr:hypothetical protein GPB2148_2017 [marine gamma proteobacterium HTCC2148]
MDNVTSINQGVIAKSESIKREIDYYDRILAQLDRFLGQNETLSMLVDMLDQGLPVPNHKRQFGLAFVKDMITDVEAIDPSLDETGSDEIRDDLLSELCRLEGILGKTSPLRVV